MSKESFDKSKYFQCDICKGVYKRKMTDEELVKQFDEEFPDHDIEDTGMVCEDCFQKYSRQWGVKES